MTGLTQALKEVNGDLSGGQHALQQSLAKQVIDGPYGKISLDSRHQAVFDNWVVQIIPPPAGSNVPAIRTISRIPNVDQSFGGFFSPTTPAPDRSNPVCTKKTPPPWVGNAVPVNFSGP
jgi:hypothetical protein